MRKSVQYHYETDKKEALARLKREDGSYTETVEEALRMLLASLLTDDVHKGACGSGKWWFRGAQLHEGRTEHNDQKKEKEGKLYATE